MIKKVVSLFVLITFLETSMAFASNWKYVDSAEFRGVLADYYIDIDSISIDQDDGKNVELHLFVRINFSKYIRGVKYVTLKKHLKKVDADKYSCNSVVVAHDGDGNIIYDSGNIPLKYQTIIPDTIEDEIFEVVYHLI